MHRLLQRLRAIFGPNTPHPDTTSRVTVRNGSKHPLLVISEPWCQTYTLAPDAEYVFEATSPRPGWLTVQWSEDAATVYAWDACIARVYDPGGTLLDTLDVRVPDFIGLDEEARLRKV